MKGFETKHSPHDALDEPVVRGWLLSLAAPFPSDRFGEPDVKDRPVGLGREQITGETDGSQLEAKSTFLGKLWLVLQWARPTWGYASSSVSQYR